MAGYVATDAGAYERSMGRWSRLLADRFLDALALPRGAAVLDAGCGTGALAAAIAARDPAARVTGVDVSEPFLAAARARVPGAAFRHGDIAALPDADGAFDAALSLLVLQFVPDRAAAVAELARVTRPGGVVAAAMWDFVGGFTFVRAFADVIAASEPDGEAFRTRYLGDSMGSPGRLAALFEAAGLREVAERDIAIRQDFADFADMWTPWLTGQGVAGAYVAALPPERRPRVEALARRAYLCGAPDGPRSFVAVARMAVGRRA
ncbi:methyltransferase domain-containing protein [Roseomonas sp. PWR1]|uniref:Methyltransferase domain-containing protein n=1 Tax=Roseomonas nitratireducens TaxID=2820810 RepID=A0ABS4AP02_9PROT|nr:class I SAM-dependent methyltransferase [Neoroseomonas nitratireducens]MBP0462551.1 methyltransferase domain-containing protein [Neoroseomonas nitratireducens]